MRKVRYEQDGRVLDGVLGLQIDDGQWLGAKALDMFLPPGPAIVTPDEVGDRRGRGREPRRPCNPVGPRVEAQDAGLQLATTEE